MDHRTIEEALISNMGVEAYGRLLDRMYSLCRKGRKRGKTPH